MTTLPTFDMLDTFLKPTASAFSALALAYLYEKLEQAAQARDTNLLATLLQLFERELVSMNERLNAV